MAKIVTTLAYFVALTAPVFAGGPTPLPAPEIGTARLRRRLPPQPPRGQINKKGLKIP